MDVLIQQLNILRTNAEQQLWSEVISLSEELLNIYPNNIAIIEVYATAMAHIGKTDRAIELYQRALLLGLPLLDVLDGVGTAFLITKKYSQALENYEIALQHFPNNITIHQRLVVVYQGLGNIEKVVQSAQIVLRSDPAEYSTLSNLASMYKNLGLIDQAIHLYTQALHHFPDGIEYKSNLLWCFLHSNKYSSKKLLQKCKLFWNHEISSTLPLNQPKKEQTTKLRIGFVSPDINDHVVGHFVIPLFPYLQERFDIFVYSNSVFEDSLTQKAKNTVQKFTSIISLGTEQVVEMIQNDNIDILIDLVGHTGYNRMDVFLKKPVSCQVTWLGFPTTTGIPTMDYIIVPPDSYLLEENWSTETPVALPNSYYSREFSYIPELPTNTKSNDSKSSEIIFACMNHFAKVSDGCLKVWSQILRKVKHAKLILLIRGIDQDIVRKSLLLRCKKVHLDPNQLILKNRLSKKEYFALYQQVDIVLDPFPFNGGTTNVDCLCMHRPFVTLSGDSLHSRLGRNLLMQVELPEFIANSKAEYVNIAVELAQDPQKISKVSQKIQQRIHDSSLLKVEQFARELGDVFEKIIDEHRNTENFD
jgi:protein O-GlcNAc transferase